MRSADFRQICRVWPNTFLNKLSAVKKKKVNSRVHRSSAFGPGASGLPCYCTPLVCSCCHWRTIGKTPIKKCNNNSKVILTGQTCGQNPNIWILATTSQKHFFSRCSCDGVVVLGTSTRFHHWCREKSSAHPLNGNRIKDDAPECYFSWHAETELLFFMTRWHLAASCCTFALTATHVVWLQLVRVKSLWDGLDCGGSILTWLPFVPVFETLGGK